MKLYIKNTDNNNYSEIACNYASLNIYNADTEKVLYTTCRLTGSTSLDFDLYIDNIRSARKLNLKKNDIFEVKTTKDTFLNNGKDLYIPDTIIKIVSQEEKLALEANGCKDYKQVYTIEFIGCKAYKTNRHSEVVDFPEGTKIADYDPNGIASNGYIIEVFVSSKEKMRIQQIQRFMTLWKTKMNIGKMKMQTKIQH